MVIGQQSEILSLKGPSRINEHLGYFECNLLLDMELQTNLYSL